MRLCLIAEDFFGLKHCPHNCAIFNPLMLLGAFDAVLIVEHANAAGVNLSTKEQYLCQFESQ